MTRPRFVGGALLAAGAAGPLLLLIVAVEGALLARPLSRSQMIEIATLFWMIWPFAFLVALLPALAGAAVLAAFGKEHRWIRSPITWAVAGLLIGGAVGGALSGAPGDSRPLAIAGALAALLARWQTSWPARPGRETSA